jgi:hypothetical protein
VLFIPYVLLVNNDQIAGYKPFKKQKNAYTGNPKVRVSCDRAKVLKQVAEVVEDFIVSQVIALDRNLYTDINEFRRRERSPKTRFRSDHGLVLEELV